MKKEFLIPNHGVNRIVDFNFIRPFSPKNKPKTTIAISVVFWEKRFSPINDESRKLAKSLADAKKAQRLCQKKNVKVIIQLFEYRNNAWHYQGILGN